MHVELKCLIQWPETIAHRHNLPCDFQKHFPNVRCIIDRSEIFIERPIALQARVGTCIYSNYKKKKHNTVKVFIAIAPTGSVAFISKAWGGRASDKEQHKNVDFLKNLSMEIAS